MTELMRILYEYASKSRLASSLEDCQQRQESAEIMERSLRALQASLDAEAARKEPSMSWSWKPCSARASPSARSCLEVKNLYLQPWNAV